MFEPRRLSWVWVCLSAGGGDWLREPWGLCGWGIRGFGELQGRHFQRHSELPGHPDLTPRQLSEEISRLAPSLLKAWPGAG